MIRRFVLVAGLGTILGACAAPKPPAPSAAAPKPAISAAYREDARAGRAVYRLDAAASRVEILVGRAGAFASAGHLHVIEVGRLEGYARLANGGGRADLVFPLAAMVVDPPAARSALGGAYAEPLGESQREGTRANMLGAKGLDAARYPWAHLAITAPATASGSVPITAAISLHGITRQLSAKTALAFDAKHLQADGELHLRQSNFGITPYSVLLGALKVADTLDIRYHLRFTRWCPVPGPTSC
ncbi:MAG TPA: YceI family protein [Gammaproteobacteria bacterium]|nr:YceI family protein [Gammaproteobacteria bacterium]